MPNFWAVAAQPKETLMLESKLVPYGLASFKVSWF
jgi:hypothetical protein